MKKSFYIICSLTLIWVVLYLPTNRPQLLTILLILSALTGAYYSFKKMKK